MTLTLMFVTRKKQLKMVMLTMILMLTMIMVMLTVKQIAKFTSLK